GDVKQVEGAKRAAYDPYQELYGLFDQLCPDYLSASADERSAIRSAVSRRSGIVSMLVSYVHRAATQLHAPPDREWLLRGLAAASIENCGQDYRDTFLALADLWVAAEAGGIDPQPAFAQVARLSDAARPRGGPTPMTEVLAGFHGYAVLAERRRQPR